MVGLTWHNGAFNITHRAEYLIGAVSRATKEGQVSMLFDWIVDNQAEHQINDIALGPDGMMYVTVGTSRGDGTFCSSLGEENS